MFWTLPPQAEDGEVCQWNWIIIEVGFGESQDLHKSSELGFFNYFIKFNT